MNQNKQSELEKRHISEKTFHDSKYSQKKRKNLYDLGFNSIIFDIMMEMIGDIRNKKVVDFGCGSGWQTKILASKGAEVWAFDISQEAVKKAKDLVNHLNTPHKVHFDQMTAENLTYKDSFFDLVIGNAILHHLDLNLAIKGIHRILKKGGKAYFLEPLGHNPLINLYRKFTPELRTKDEVPLRFTHFDIIRKHFSRFEHEEYYLITLLAFFWYFIIRQDNLFLKSRDFLFKLDEMILTIFPYLKKYCWYSILVMEK